MVIEEAAPEANCAESLVSHTFVGAHAPDATDNESLWVSSESVAESDGLTFLQVIESPDGQAVLVVGDVAYPGVVEDDVWTFSWQRSETWSETEAYSDEYRYDMTEVHERAETYRLTFAGDAMIGTLEVREVVSTVWHETDTWGEDVSRAAGVIPAGSYLVTDDEDGEEVAVKNSRSEEECTTSTCELQVETVCSSSQALTGTRTGWLTGQDFEGLTEIGQESGL